MSVALTRRAHRDAVRRRAAGGRPGTLPAVGADAWDDRLALEGDADRLLMQAQDEGWHELVTDRARPGTRYRFVLPDGALVPDPASRHQPEDVHGPSEVVDPAAYAWSDAGWQGRRWEEAVLYELHVGAFTPRGHVSCRHREARPPRGAGCHRHRAHAGGAFPGRRNWGYDGVLPFAPDATYGRPEDLKALVDAAHGRGLMVLLDVVYNHFGPEGAYIHAIAPAYLHRPLQNAMGGGDQLRRRAFRPGPGVPHPQRPLLDRGIPPRRPAAGRRARASSTTARRICWRSWRERVRAAAPGRQLHLVLENEENQARRLVARRGRQPRPVHGAMERRRPPRAACRGHGRGGRLLCRLRRQYGSAGPGAGRGLRVPGRGHALSRPCARRAQRGPAAHRLRRVHPEPRPGRQPRLRRPGDRLAAGRGGARRSPPSTCCCRRCRCCSWARNGRAAQPFPFFCDFGPDLADAVREGRRDEFARFPEFQDPAARERIPDPLADATFASAKLGWERPRAGTAQRLARLVSPRAGRAAGADRAAAGRHATPAGATRWSARVASSCAGASCGRRPSCPCREPDGGADGGLPARPGRTLWQEGAAGDDGLFGRGRCAGR